MEISAISVATPRLLEGRASHPLRAACPSKHHCTCSESIPCGLHRGSTTATNQRSPYAAGGHGRIHHRHDLGFCVQLLLRPCSTAALPRHDGGRMKSPSRTGPDCGPRCSEGCQSHHPTPIAGTREPSQTNHNWRGSPGLSRVDGGTCPHLIVPGCRLGPECARTPGRPDRHRRRMLLQNAYFKHFGMRACSSVTANLYANCRHRVNRDSCLGLGQL